MSKKSEKRVETKQFPQIDLSLSPEKYLSVASLPDDCSEIYDAQDMQDIIKPHNDELINKIDCFCANSGEIRESDVPEARLMVFEYIKSWESSISLGQPRSSVLRFIVNEHITPGARAALSAIDNGMRDIKSIREIINK